MADKRSVRGLGVVALLLSLSACGDEVPLATTPETSTTAPQLTAEARRAVASLQEAFVASDYTGDASIANCLATGYVDRLGVAWLKKSGVLTDDLRAHPDAFPQVMSEADANTSVDVYFSCEDYRRVVASMVDGSDQPDMDDPYVTNCVNAVTEAEIREAFVAGYSDQEFHSTPFAKKLEAAGCGYEGD